MKTLTLNDLEKELMVKFYNIPVEVREKIIKSTVVLEKYKKKIKILNHAKDLEKLFTDNYLGYNVLNNKTIILTTLEVMLEYKLGLFDYKMCNCGMGGSLKFWSDSDFTCLNCGFKRNDLERKFCHISDQVDEIMTTNNI